MGQPVQEAVDEWWVAMRCEAFIVHLARAEGRRGAVQAASAAVGMPVTVVDAVDGQRLSDAELEAAYVPDGLHAPRYPFALGRGEIACFLSHRKVWAMIIEKGLDFGLVLEDDVLVDPSALARAVAVTRAVGTGAEYVSLQTRPVPRGSVIGTEDGCRLVEAVPPPLRTSGQIVGREAAARLLDMTARFDRPIDVLLQMTWVTGVRVLCADPSGISDWPDQMGGSVAQVKRRRGVVESLRRDVARTIYRRRIASLARAGRSA